MSIRLRRLDISYARRELNPLWELPAVTKADWHYLGPAASRSGTCMFRSTIVYGHELSQSRETLGGISCDMISAFRGRAIPFRSLCAILRYCRLNPHTKRPDKFSVPTFNRSPRGFAFTEAYAPAILSIYLAIRTNLCGKCRSRKWLSSVCPNCTMLVVTQS